MVGMSRLKSSNTAGHGQVVALSRRCLDEASVLVWQVPFPHCWLSGHRTAVVLCPWKPAGVRFGWEEEPSTHCVVPRVDAKYPDCSKHEAWNSQGTFLPLLLSGPSPPHVTQGARKAQLPHPHPRDPSGFGFVSIRTRPQGTRAWLKVGRWGFAVYRVTFVLHSCLLVFPASTAVTVPC